MNFEDRYGVTRNELRLLISEGRRLRVRHFRNEPRPGWYPDPSVARTCDRPGCEKPLPPKNTKFCSQKCRDAQMWTVRHSQQIKYATEEERVAARHASQRRAYYRRVCAERGWDYAEFVAEREARRAAREQLRAARSASHRSLEVEARA